MCSICSFTSLISPFESTLEDWEVMSSILTHDRMKKSNFLRRFQLFRHLTESKMCSILDFLEDWEVLTFISLISPQKISTFFSFEMCSLALLHPWFPPWKAPLKIGRSWVQFLLMTEWKNPIFSEDFNFFDIRPRAKCVLCSFTSLISPFESTLEDWEVMSSILTHDRMKKSNFLEDFNFFDITES